jgi:hypothetical protein
MSVIQRSYFCVPGKRPFILLPSPSHSARQANMSIIPASNESYKPVQLKNITKLSLTTHHNVDTLKSLLLNQNRGCILMNS